MAAERYRVEVVRNSPAIGLHKYLVMEGATRIAECWTRESADIVAAALAAAEDAGRRNAALEGLVDFITDIRASGDCGYFEINAQPGERFFQAALKALEAPEPKEGNVSDRERLEAERLFRILDDIDTADDLARNDDRAYRLIVGKLQAKRWKGPIRADGYSLTWLPETSTARPA